MEILMKTPSQTAILTYEDEICLRRRYARYIRAIGDQLEMQDYCINTAILYMQLFYMEKSLTKFNGFDIGNVSIQLTSDFLGYTYSNETILQTAYNYVYPKKAPLDVTSQEYIKRLEKLREYTKHFNLFLDHAKSQRHLPANILACVRLWRVSMTKKLPLMANTIANEVYVETPLSLAYNGNEIGAFCVYLTCKLVGYRQNDGNPIWNDIDPTITMTKLKQMECECTVLNQRFPEILRGVYQDNLNMCSYNINSPNQSVESTFSTSHSDTTRQEHDTLSTRTQKRKRYTLEEYKNRKQPKIETEKPTTELKGEMNLDEASLRQLFHGEPKKLYNFLKCELTRHRQLTERETHFLNHLQRNREIEWLSRYRFVSLRHQKTLLREKFQHEPQQLFKLLTVDIPSLRPLVADESDYVKVLQPLFGKKTKQNELQQTPKQLQNQEGAAPKQAACKIACH